MLESIPLAATMLPIGIIAIALCFTIKGFLIEDCISVPGPWVARWTSIVADYHWIVGSRPHYVHSLHLKYGPIVRVTPNEIDVCDLDVVQYMHKSGSGFLKAEWYDRLTINGVKNIFSVRDPKQHSTRRRLLSHPLSDSALDIMQPIIDEKIQLAISQMEIDGTERSVTDVFKWWYFMSTDLIGELTFGHSFDLLERGEKEQMATDLEMLPQLGMIGTAFPFLLSLAGKLPLPILSNALQAGNRIADYADQSIRQYWADAQQEGAALVKPTLFTRLFHSGDISDIDICSEAQGYIVGGSDNTATTLTYLVWAVCRDVKIKDALLHDLSSLPGKFSDADLRNLSFLDYVIKETLRLYATNPSNRPRECPAPGANIGKYWIPKTINVSTQAFSLHRDPSVFSEPEKFNPWRWETMTKDMSRAHVPFGGGSRSKLAPHGTLYIKLTIEIVCLGLHLAMREIRSGAVAFFRAFPKACVSQCGMCDADMEQVCYFIMSPRGKRCLIDLCVKDKELSRD